MASTSSIRVGQIGVGTHGGAFARAYATTPPMKLMAICDIDESRARAAADAHGVPAVYRDFRDMLER
jgi:predicted dehydrogenase